MFYGYAAFWARNSLVLVMLAAAFPTAGAAQDSSKTASAQSEQYQGEDDHHLRLNFVDRQRMLNEMIVKSLCLVDQRVKRSMYRNQLAVAQFAYQETLLHLTQGSAALKLAPEAREELRKAIEDLKAEWVKYAAVLNGWSVARWGKKLFAVKVYEVNEALAVRLQQVNDLYRGVYEKQRVIGSEARAGILLAGRQRMLTQKMTKELCQLAQSYNVDETRKRLNESLSQFAKTTKTLAKGDPEAGLNGEPPGMALELMERSEAVFATAEPILTAAASGNLATPEQLSLVAEANDKALHTWGKAASVYELLKERASAEQQDDKHCAAGTEQLDAKALGVLRTEGDDRPDISNRARDRLDQLAEPPC